ncbi:17760_t:CDS:2 [Dentiscutata erythropus]|uniref:17760_t:CDS:1 n=1 Tax=Dentiscutata erythropus TaxID=1348616 RepID=A0A9N9F586_9GLOM|nr:17760_t:CDS:2 [Dentiscutata erythropus]
MPAIGMNVIITGQTTQTIKTEEENAVLNFYIKKRFGEKDLSNFWVEVKHKANNNYLANRTNAINQKIWSTTTLLVGTMNYHPSIPNSSEGKHVLTLEDISLLSSNLSNTSSNSQHINIPGCPKEIALHMGPTTIPTSNNLQAALDANPMPNMAKQNNETNSQSSQTDESAD